MSYRMSFYVRKSSQMPTHLSTCLIYTEPDASNELHMPSHPNAAVCHPYQIKSRSFSLSVQPTVRISLSFLVAVVSKPSLQLPTQSPSILFATAPSSIHAVDSWRLKPFFEFLVPKVRVEALRPTPPVALPSTLQVGRQEVKYPVSRPSDESFVCGRGE